MQQNPKYEYNQRHNNCSLNRKTSTNSPSHRTIAPKYAMVKNGTNGNVILRFHRCLHRKNREIALASRDAKKRTPIARRHPTCIPRSRIIQLSPYPIASLEHLLTNRNNKPNKAPVTRICTLTVLHNIATHTTTTLKMISKYIGIVFFLASL